MADIKVNSFTGADVQSSVRAVVAMVTETSLILGFLVVFPTFLRGPLSAGPPGASWAPAAVTFEVSLFSCKLLTSFNIQPQVHHVTFELFTWIL